MRPLHLVDVAPPWQSGYTVRTHELALAQKSVDMQPAVAARPTPFLEPSYRHLSDGVALVRSHDIEYFRRTEPRRFIRWWILLSRYLESKDVRGAARLRRRLALPTDPWEGFLERLQAYFAPTIAHAHTPAANFQGATRLQKMLGIPTVYEVRGFWDLHLSDRTDPNTRIRGVRLSEWRARENRAAELADAVVTLGEAMREELVHRGVPREKIYIVGNGVNPDVFSGLPTVDNELLESWGFRGAFVLGYVTSVNRYEGVDVILEAVRELRSTGRQVVFVLVGDGPDLPRLEQLAEELGVADAVRFVGRIPRAEVRRYYGLMDAFVVPRVDDAVCRIVTPLKPLEAMALEVPTVISRIPALCELVEPDERGWAFRAGDSSALAKVVMQMMGNPERTRELARNARSWVVRERSWSKLALRTRSIYERVSEKKHRSGPQ